MIKKVLKVVIFLVFLLVVVIIATNSFVYVMTKEYIFDDIENTPLTEVVLVPGAAVSTDGVLSPIFTDRADTAIAMYGAGKVGKILVSGDNSTESYNELNPLREYLLKKGVADADIFLDYAGFDTYSSMYRARDIFGVTSVVISTQSFHLPRAVFIARQLGLDAYGINADDGNILTRNYIREMLATEKAVIDLLLKREPKFLGEPVPMTDVSEEEVSVCDADAMLCPDGSSLGRTGPTCEFTACPTLTSTSTLVATKLGESGTAMSVTVTPQEIVSDSRCPREVVCIWAGTVEVRTTLSTPVAHGEHVLTLGEPEGFGDYIVTLVAVTPEKTQTEIKASDYKFMFEIKES